MTEEEALKLLKRAPKLWIRALFAFIWMSGCKLVTALSLRRLDASWDQHELRIKTEDYEATFPINNIYAETVVRYLDRIRDLDRGKHGDRLLWPISRIKAWKLIKRLHPRGKVTPAVLREGRMVIENRGQIA